MSLSSFIIVNYRLLSFYRIILFYLSVIKVAKKRFIILYYRFTLIKYPLLSLWHFALSFIILVMFRYYPLLSCFILKLSFLHFYLSFIILAAFSNYPLLSLLGLDYYPLLSLMDPWDNYRLSSLPQLSFIILTVIIIILTIIILYYPYRNYPLLSLL